MSTSARIFAFAAVEAIRCGEWDDHLLPLWTALRDRRDLLNPTRKPTRQLGPAQHWVWMHGPGTPHWEVCGTGAKL